MDFKSLEVKKAYEWEMGYLDRAVLDAEQEIESAQKRLREARRKRYEYLKLIGQPV